MCSNRIVDSKLFFAAREIILARSQRLTNEEMLEKLRGVFAKHGRISGILIDEEDACHRASAFRHRFGSLVAAYRLVGYTPEIDYSFIEVNRVLRQRHADVVADVLTQLKQLGASVIQEKDTGC